MTDGVILLAHCAATSGKKKSEKMTTSETACDHNCPSTSWLAAAHGTARRPHMSG